MKTIRLYHPHTHEGIAYDPPPEGIELSVNDADAAVLETWGLTTPPPVIADATTAPATDAPVAHVPLTDAVVVDATPPHTHVANATDRRARVAVDLPSTEPAADTTARSV
jgi:hypothetical protein